MATTRQALHMMESITWRTPKPILVMARQVMGGIDLDPATTEGANERVKARRIYTPETDGLEHDWSGRIWLNPPYGRDGQAVWSEKLIHEFTEGHIRQAVGLFNAATGARWFEPLWKYPLCFVVGRIAFIGPNDMPATSPTHYSVVVYLGHRVEKFWKIFSRLGAVVESTS